MHSKTKSAAGLIIVATLCLVASHNTQAIEWTPQSGTKFWVDCATGLRISDCIESVEFSDPKSEKRDSNGFLDYSRIVWKKTTVVVNPKFTYNSLPPGSIWKQEKFGMPCIGGKEAWFSVGGFYHDACYTAPGLNPDGSDIVFHLLINSDDKRIQVAQWIDIGVSRNWNRQDGWEVKSVPEGSTWRIIFKSDTLATKTGVISSNMKNPNIRVVRGTDGIYRTVFMGTVYTNQYGCRIPNLPFKNENNRIDCEHPESYAESASTGFNIVIAPYLDEYESLEGFEPGGIFVSGPTQSLGEVQYDPEQAIVTVPMFGPHFMFDRKTLNKGWMEVAVKGEVIRRAFRLNPAQAGNIVKVEISEGDGTPEIATYASRYLQSLDVFEIRAYNFGFSNPVLTVKLKSNSNENSKIVSPRKKMSRTITCIKRGQIKKIRSTNAKCPAGFKKK